MFRMRCNLVGQAPENAESTRPHTTFELLLLLGFPCRILQASALMEAEPTQAGIERQVAAAEITGKVAHVACKMPRCSVSPRNLDLGRGLEGIVTCVARRNMVSVGRVGFACLDGRGRGLETQPRGFDWS